MIPLGSINLDQYWFNHEMVQIYIPSVEKPACRNFVPIPTSPQELEGTKKEAVETYDRPIESLVG